MKRSGLEFEVLEERAVPAIEAFGSGPGSIGVVQVYNAGTANDPNAVLRSFIPYGTNFTGGVRVAVGDVNGDGTSDIVTAPGPGGGPDIRVYDGVTGLQLFTIPALNPDFRGGANVAVADVNGDHKADVIVGAGAGGGPQVQVFDAATHALINSFFAYEPSFGGGVTVAAGVVGPDAGMDVVTGPGPGGGPVVRAFNGTTGAMVQSFAAFSGLFRGGVTVATMADPFGSDKDDVIVGAGPGGGPQVQIFRSDTLVNSFFAYDPSYSGGIHVAGFDLPQPSGGPISVIVTGTDAIASQVTARNGKDLSHVENVANSFFVFAGLFPGVTVAAE